MRCAEVQLQPVWGGGGAARRAHPWEPGPAPAVEAAQLAGLWSITEKNVHWKAYYMQCIFSVLSPCHCCAMRARFPWLGVLLLLLLLLSWHGSAARDTHGRRTTRKGKSSRRPTGASQQDAGGTLRS